MSKTTAVFIDFANISIAAKIFFPELRLDWKKLMQWLKQVYDPITTNIYIVENPFNDEEVDRLERHEKYQNFCKRLEIWGYNVTNVAAKIHLQHGERIVKGNIDTMMAYELGKLFGSVDRVVIFSGDGDFAGIAKDMRRHAVETIVIASEKNTAKDLINAVQKERFTPLELIIDNFSYKRENDLGALPQQSLPNVMVA